MMNRQRLLHCADDARHVRNIASALSVALNIASGNQLVMVLGAGDEQSNQEALETWTRLQLAPLEGMTNQQLLAELLTRLEKHLFESLEAGQ